MEFKKYNEEDELSFTFGGYPTFELIKNRPSDVVKIFVSDKLEKNDEWQKIENLCKQNNIIIEQNEKQLERLAPKGNVFVVGVFKKYKSQKITLQNSVVLDKPSDMGNLGTIMREMLGFDYKNLILIKPHADIFNPKTIRASMGAIFSLNIVEFESFAEFEKQNKLPLYLFMLNGTTNLSQIESPKMPNALVFGNEATGLPKEYVQKGTSVRIYHSDNIDSLNLSMSAGIALFQFTKKNF